MRTNRHTNRAVALLAFMAPLPALAATYYVAPTGSDSAAGSESAPWGSIAHAQSSASAGDTIYVRGGTYSITAGTNTCSSQTATVNAIALTKSGTAGNLIKYWAYAGETPVFDYSNLQADCRVKGFDVTGNYIHMKGITVTGVKQRNNQNHESWGVWVSGSNNIFELLDIYHIDGTGLFIQNGSNNLVLNSDSHENFDPLTSNGACESGDGFGAHISANNPGNVFRGCRSWTNSDDDYDLINAFSVVTIENCWAWHAGYRYDTGAGCGNGNGFKCGGYGTDTSTFPANPPVHVIRNNLSIGNRAAGFYANHHPGTITFYNNTSYNNNPDFKMLGMNTSGADITVGTYRNNLAVGGTLTANATNPDDASNSWTLSVTANTADFQSTSETGLDGPRQADGSLPNIANFHLVAGSDLIDKGVDVGLPFNGSAPDLGCFETGGAAGGTSSTGGASSTGGNNATGGTSSAGGSKTTGGAASTGGSKATTAGATSGAGGTKATGGSVGAGGTAAVTGGTTGNGGTKATGGTNALVGGTTGTGGPSTGGLNGTIGGAVAAGGGTAAAGGGQSTGGLANLGGTSLGAGTTSVGGNANIGGASASGTSEVSDTGANAENSGSCGCRIPAGHASRFGFAGCLTLVGLAYARMRRRRHRS
jgi:hypothetical protein